MSITVEIIVKRADKIYHDGEQVNGIIQITSSTDIKHDGIMLTMEGAVNLQISSRNAGIIDAFYSSVKPILLVNSTCEISSGSKIPAGVTQIPFQIPLKAKSNRILYETYHGVYVNICYILKCDIRRSFLSKDIQKSQEFLVQSKHSILPSVKEMRGVDINLTPQAILGALDFHLTGRLNSTYCNISKPFRGHLKLKKCSIPLRSLEVQLVRVETCGCAEGFAKESTEIQNIQIGDGDIPQNTEIPIYMIFPRLFTCPTLIEHNFKIGICFKMSANFKTPVMVLQEYAMRKKIGIPIYKELTMEEKHYNEFGFEVRIAGLKVTGKGRSKKVAKQNTAYNALETLNNLKMFDLDFPPKDYDPNLHKCENDNDKKLSVNFVVFLQECCAHNKLPEPFIRQVSDVGPLHCRKFTYECKISSLTTQSTEITKKRAKQMAAKQMIEKIMTIIPNLDICLSDWQNAFEENSEEGKEKSAEKDSKVIDSKNESAEKDSKVIDRKKQSAEKDSKVIDIKKESAGKDSKVIDSKKESAEKVSKVIDSKKENAEKDSQVIDSKKESAENDSKVIDSKKESAEKNSKVIDSKKAKIVDFPNCLKRLMKKKNLEINDFKELLKLQDEHGVKNILDMLGLQYELIKLQDNPIVLALNINVDTTLTVLVKGTSEDSAKEDLFKHTMTRLKSYINAATCNK
ncbi:uncharacterized protein LOC123676721 isoform X2 [Harmonia axyridis]|uniref:uncharacterized protein LOC123676721 isoform X2 n=1 Tax=Harmonia axyridis TaxID=115357 RepID=UPI001E27710A|nr:uncharacterized protein LOC123676721 isoform X2 [Harmonia axyridis]